MKCQKCEAKLHKPLDQAKRSSGKGRKESEKYEIFFTVLRWLSSLTFQNLKNKMRAHKKLGTSPYLSAIQVHPQLQLRLLPNSCQTLGVSVCVSVCVCVWVFLGWTTSAYPCRTSCHIYPKLCKSKWLYYFFFPFFRPTLDFFFLLSTFCSLRSAWLLHPLPLHCYFHLKFPQGYNEMRQKISRASNGIKKINQQLGLLQCK